MSYAAKYFKITLLGLSDTVWTIIFAAIWGFIAFLPIILNRQYISYSDDGEFIVFKYFSSSIFGGSKNFIKIEKKTFGGYKTEKQLMGLSQSLTLYLNTSDGIAKYPPVDISALSKREKAKIFGSLNQYSQ
jgi:hypothetical protein